MNEIYLTSEEAEEIIMAEQVGMYNIDALGARSKLAHARLLMASQDVADTIKPCSEKQRG